MSERPHTGPLLQAARLFQKTSAKGTTYFTGRWGSLKVVILENRDHNPDDAAQAHSHTLFLTAAEPHQPKPHNGVLPFRPKPSEPPPPDVPPWEDQPTAPNWRGPPRHRPDDRLRKRAAGGSKSMLIDDIVPF